MDISFFFSALFLLIACFIPILLWGYFFSFIDSSSFNKKRFFVGIFAWSLGVLPILFLDKIIKIPALSPLNIFGELIGLWSLWSYIGLFLSYSFLILLLSMIFVWLGMVLQKKIFWKWFFSSLGAIFFIILIIVLSFFLMTLLSNIFPELQYGNTWISPIFWDAIFNTLKLLVFYYVTVAFLEESIKHLSFLSSSAFQIDTMRKWVLYAIFIALGFSFFENILYAAKALEEQGFWLKLAIIILFRSIFSLFIHVFSSAILWYFFAKAYLLFLPKKSYKGALLSIVLWLTLSILVHFSYDFLLTLGYSSFIFIYFIMGYFSISKIIFKH